MHSKPIKKCMGTENTEFKIEATSNGYVEKCDPKEARRSLLSFSSFIFKLDGALVSIDYRILLAFWVFKMFH